MSVFWCINGEQYILVNISCIYECQQYWWDPNTEPATQDFHYPTNEHRQGMFLYARLMDCQLRRDSTSVRVGTILATTWELRRLWTFTHCHMAGICTGWRCSCTSWTYPLLLFGGIILRFKIPFSEVLLGPDLYTPADCRKDYYS